MLINNRSIALDDTRAPSGNTIVFSILARNIFSPAKVPAMMCVDRVPS